MNETTETTEKTAGGRQLTDADRDFLEAIKAHERAGMVLIKRICDHLARQVDHARVSTTAFSESTRLKAAADLERMAAAEPQRWASIARTNMQQGYMALVRSVEQPDA